MRAEVAKAESPTNDNNSEAEADQNVTVVPSPPLCESTHIEDAPIKKNVPPTEVFNHTETHNGEFFLGNFNRYIRFKI